MDKYKIEQAVRLFLEGIGENPDREGLIDTPSRVSNMCEELFAGLNTSAESHLSKTFTADTSGLVVVCNAAARSGRKIYFGLTSKKLCGAQLS